MVRPYKYKPHNVNPQLTVSIPPCFTTLQTILSDEPILTIFLDISSVKDAGKYQSPVPVSTVNLGPILRIMGRSHSIARRMSLVTSHFDASHYRGSRAWNSLHLLAINLHIHILMPSCHLCF